ncbi:hypothetical protein NDU88_006441 [Pleurodeles waltl]|uniref:Uncharacterized protein n=1 Tax=Pleurodeles waltl TaxID=8319 RepID=A0AAV7WDI0_PLEWA|nr:hypothetical protein NDU88_006441 [Pleurodeles waltl]
MSYLLVCPDAQAAKPSAGTIHRWRFLCSLHSEGSRSHTGCHLSPNPLGRLLLSGDPLFPTVGLTWSGGYSRLSGSQVTLKPTRRPRRQSPHSGSRHLTGAGWRFPPFAMGTEPQVQKKVPLPGLGGRALAKMRSSLLIQGEWSGRLWGTGGVGASWQCCGQAPDPGAVRVRAGESAPAVLPVMQAGRSGSEAGNAGGCSGCLQVGPQAGAGQCRSRGSPRELSVEGGLRSEARSRHGDAAGCGCCQCLLGAQGASAACSPRRW